MEFFNSARRNGVSKLCEMTDIDVERRGKYRSTPIFGACSFGSLDVVRYLINERGARIDVRNDFGETPLFSACNRLSGDPEVARYLVTECGAQVDVEDNRGKSPLDYARSSYNVKMIKFLEEALHNTTVKGDVAIDTEGVPSHPSETNRLTVAQRIENLEEEVGIPNEIAAKSKIIDRLATLEGELLGGGIAGRIVGRLSILEAEII